MTEDHLQELAVSGEIGDALLKAGRYTEAVGAFRKCVEIRERLAEADSRNIEHLRELAVSYGNMGDALVGVAGVLNANISNTRVAPERLAGALAAYRKSEMILESLAAANPAKASLQRDLSVTYDKIGDVLMVTGNIDEALATYRKDHAIAVKLAAADPENLDRRLDASVSYGRVGDALAAGGQIDDAIAMYRIRSVLVRTLGAIDPENEEKIRTLLRAGGRARSDPSVNGRDVRKNKRLGIASLIVALVCVLFLIGFGSNYQVVLGGSYRAIECALFSFCFLDLVGLALGIAGVLDRTAKKTFPTLGIIIGSVVLPFGVISLLLTIWPLQTPPS